jgi:hypothetical protein
MNSSGTPDLRKRIIRRAQEHDDFEAVLPLDSTEHALLVEAVGGLGKTWFLRGLQLECEEKGILHNRVLIDFYDTPSQRLSGLMHQIIKEIDPDGVHYRPYLDLRKEFDEKWQQTEEIFNDEPPLIGGGARSGRAQTPESAGANWFTQNERAAKLNEVFLECTREYGLAHRKGNQRGVALFFDTYEVVREGRVGRWFAREFVPASQDIVVVVATRPSYDGSPMLFPKRSVRHCTPGNFTEQQILEYLRVQWSGNPAGLSDAADLALTPEQVSTLASLIYRHSGGLPVLVTLAHDIITLTSTSTFDDVRRILSEAAAADSFLEGLIEKLIEALGDDKFRGHVYQQWAVLYMALFRRRFNGEIYAFLQGKPRPDSQCDLGVFQDFGVVKSRGYNSETGVENHQSGEASVLLHDIVRDAIYERFWRRSLPKQIVMRGQREGVFPQELAATWDDSMAMAQTDDIDSSNLRPALDWLNNRIAEYYESEERRHRDQQQSSQDSTSWKHSEVRRQALCVERFLYELDRDTGQTWRRIRREYDEAFEAYRQGYCELLELTVLSAWSHEEATAGSYQAEIKDMMRVRQWWWRIRHSQEARYRAMQHLGKLLRESSGSPRSQRELSADIHSALGWASELDGELENAIQHREASVKLYRELAFERELERVLNFLGLSYAQQGTFKHADKCWEEALDIALRQNPRDHAEIGSVAMKRAYYKGLSGELSPAIGYINLAQRHFDQAGDPRRLGMCLAYKARIYLSNVRFGHADRALNEAEKLLTRVANEDDEALWRTARSEFLRRRAIDQIEKLAPSREGQRDNDNGAKMAAIEHDLSNAETYLQDVLTIAHRNNKPMLLGIEALGERGALFRDRARFLAEQDNLDKAWEYWRCARTDLEAALKQSRELRAWFFVANLLDDLCDLYSDQRRLIPNHDARLDAGNKSPERLLLEHLDELESVAKDHDYDRFRSRVAEKRAKLSFERGDFRDAIRYTVLACEAVGLHTHSGHMFRNSYDKLVGDLEQRLRKLPTDEQRVELSQEAITLWGGRRLGAHPQLIIACERVLHPAQASILEREADAAFKQHDTDSAFKKYTEACHRIALRANDTYTNYAEYSRLVAKLERRLYNLDDPKDVEVYADLVESWWLQYGHFIDHPSVIDVCNRAKQMSRMDRADSPV